MVIAYVLVNVIENMVFLLLWEFNFIVMVTVGDIYI